MKSVNEFKLILWSDDEYRLRLDRIRSGMESAGMVSLALYTTLFSLVRRLMQVWRPGWTA